MSELLDTGLGLKKSESGKTQDAKCSPSRCSSSGSIVTNTRILEKSLGCSTSFETVWTDSKHSSYLDFMEANFVQSMFARSYCMADVCGGTLQHHHHQHHRHHQHACHTDLEENDYNTAESRLHSQGNLKNEGHDNRDQTSIFAEASAALPYSLLANRWVKHFRPRNVPSESLKTVMLPTKRDSGSSYTNYSGAASDETAIPIINNANDNPRASDSEKPDEPGADSSKVGETDDRYLNTSSSDTRKKRRMLWSTYKQLRRTRQKMGS